MSTSNNILKTKNNYKRIKLITNIFQIVFIIIAIATLFMFTSSNLKIMNEATDTSDFKAEDVSNYFDKRTIQTLRKIDEDDDNYSLPSGRISPF